MYTNCVILNLFQNPFNRPRNKFGVTLVDKYLEKTKSYDTI